jgi:integrase
LIPGNVHPKKNKGHRVLQTTPTTNLRENATPKTPPVSVNSGKPKLVDLSQGIRARKPKRATCHTFRHSFATQLLEGIYDIRPVQELLGHKDVKTTMIDTHVLNRGGKGVKSPVDDL